METLVALLLGVLLVLLYFRLPGAAGPHAAVCHCHQCTHLRYGGAATEGASTSPVERAAGGSGRLQAPKAPEAAVDSLAPTDASGDKLLASRADANTKPVHTSVSPPRLPPAPGPSFTRDTLPHIVPNVVKGKLKASPASKYVCDECKPPRSFGLPYALKNHKDDAHPARGRDKPKRPHGCRYCREGFPTYAEMVAHSTAAHGEGGSRVAERAGSHNGSQHPEDARDAEDVPRTEDGTILQDAHGGGDGWPRVAERAQTDDWEHAEQHPDNAPRTEDWTIPEDVQHGEDGWRLAPAEAAFGCPKCPAKFWSERTHREHLKDPFVHSSAETARGPYSLPPKQTRRRALPEDEGPEGVLDKVEWSEGAWRWRSDGREEGEEGRGAVDDEGRDEFDSEGDRASPASAIILTPAVAADDESDAGATTTESTGAAETLDGGLADSATSVAPWADASAPTATSDFPSLPAAAATPARTPWPSAKSPIEASEFPPLVPATPKEAATTPAKLPGLESLESRTPAPAARAIGRLAAPSFTPVAPGAGADPSSPSFSFTPTPHKLSWSRVASSSSSAPALDAAKPGPAQLLVGSPLPPATPPSWADETLPLSPSSPTSPTHALTRTTSASSALSSSSIWGPPANAYNAGFVTSFARPESESPPPPEPNPYGRLAGNDAPWKAAEWRLHKPVERETPVADKEGAVPSPPAPPAAVQQREWARVPTYPGPMEGLYARNHARSDYPRNEHAHNDRGGRHGGKKRGGGRRGREAKPLQPLFDEWTNLDSAAREGHHASSASSNSGDSARGRARGGRGRATRYHNDKAVPGTAAWSGVHAAPEQVIADEDDPYGGW